MRKTILFFILLTSCLVHAEITEIDKLLEAVENSDRKSMGQLQLSDLRFKRDHINSKITVDGLITLIKRSGPVVMIQNFEVEDSLNINENIAQKSKLIFINCSFKNKFVLDKAKVSKHLIFIGCMFEDDVTINDLSTKNLTFYSNKFKADLSCVAGYLDNQIDQFLFVLNEVKDIFIEAYNISIPCNYSGTLSIGNAQIWSNIINRAFCSAINVKKECFIRNNIINQLEVNDIRVDFLFLVRYNQINECKIRNVEARKQADFYFMNNFINSIVLAEMVVNNNLLVHNRLNKVYVVGVFCQLALQIRDNLFEGESLIYFYGSEVSKFSFRNNQDSIYTTVSDTINDIAAFNADPSNLMNPVRYTTDSLSGKQLAITNKLKWISVPEDNKRYSLNIRQSIINEGNWFVNFKDINKLDNQYRINPTDSVLSNRHETYTSIQKAYANQGKWNQADMCFYEWKEFERANYLSLSNESFFTKLPKTLFHYLNWISCGYGIKPLRIFPFAFFIILIFAVFYFITPQPISNLEQHLISSDKIKKELGKLSLEKLEELFSEYDFDFEKHKQDLIDDIFSSIETDILVAILGMQSKSSYSINYFWNCFYFSFSTFTTVGIGDWYPSGRLNKAIVMIEGSLGWLCLGLFITTYANILLR